MLLPLHMSSAVTGKMMITSVAIMLNQNINKTGLTKVSHVLTTVEHSADYLVPILSC